MDQSLPSDTPATTHRTQGVFRERSAEDLEPIPFDQRMATVEMPADLLERVRFKNDCRGASERLHDLEQSIRDRGYQPFDPIRARIGRKGKCLVFDGHLLTAARHVLWDFWTNLLEPKVPSLHFPLFTMPDSNTMTRER